jgi:hypothetical protein
MHATETAVAVEASARRDHETCANIAAVKLVPRTGASLEGKDAFLFSSTIDSHSSCRETEHSSHATDAKCHADRARSKPACTRRQSAGRAREGVAGRTCQRSLVTTETVPPVAKMMVHEAAPLQ